MVDGVNPPRIELVFYQTDAGNVPVRDWLLGLPPANRREIGQDLQRVQFRWPIGMPLVRPMGKGLFEVRTSLADGTIARVLAAVNSMRCTDSSRSRRRRLRPIWH